MGISLKWTTIPSIWRKRTHFFLWWVQKTLKEWSKGAKFDPDFFPLKSSEYFCVQKIDKSWVPFFIRNCCGMQIQIGKASFLLNNGNFQSIVDMKTHAIRSHFFHHDLDFIRTKIHWSNWWFPERQSSWIRISKKYSEKNLINWPKLTLEFWQKSWDNSYYQEKNV